MMMCLEEELPPQGGGEREKKQQHQQRRRRRGGGRRRRRIVASSWTTATSAATVVFCLLCFFLDGSSTTSFFKSSSIMTTVDAYSPEQLRYYDNLRTSTVTTTTTDTTTNTTTTKPISYESRPESNVLGIIDPNTNEPLSLCQITSILPLTGRDGQPNGEFGLYSMGAALLAMIHFNQRNDTISPALNTTKNEYMDKCQLKFTIESFDSQFSAIEANTRLIDDVLSRQNPQPTLSKPMPCSITGAYRSAVSGPLSLMSATQQIPQISSGSTSSQLDNKGVYPYFGRTVPSDAGIAVAAVDYLRNVLGVTHCGVFFVRDSYGLAFHQEFVDAGSLLSPPMTVVGVPFDENRQSISEALHVLSETGYNYFFGIILPNHWDDMADVATSIGLMGQPSKFWLLSDGAQMLLGKGLMYDAITQSHMISAANGVGVMSMDIRKNDAFDDAWMDLEEKKELKQYFLDLQPKEVQPKLRAWSFFTNPGLWEYMHYDAIIALGLASCKIQSEYAETNPNRSYFTGPDLFDEFRRTEFVGASGFTSFHPISGTRDYTRLSFQVWNVWAKEYDDNGSVAFNSQVVAKQMPSIPGDLTSPKTYEVLASTVYADGTNDAPQTLPPPIENYNLIPKAALGVGLCLACIAMTFSIYFASWTAYYIKCLVVRISQPEFLLMLTFGAFMMATSVIPMTLQEPIGEKYLSLACMATPWLFQTGFVIAFSALFSKIARMMRLFHGHRGFNTINRIKHFEMVVPFLVLFSISAIVLILWNTVSPLRWERTYSDALDEYGRPIESYGFCTSPQSTPFLATMIAFDIAILFGATVETYRARNVVSAYNELFYVSVSIASILQAFIIGVPSLAVADTSPTALFLIQSILVFLICAAVVLPLFVPKEISRREFDAQAVRQQKWSSLLKSHKNSSKLSSGQNSSDFKPVVSDADRPSATGGKKKDDVLEGMGSSFIYLAGQPEKNSLHVIQEVSYASVGDGHENGLSFVEEGTKEGSGSNPWSSIAEVLSSKFTKSVSRTDRDSGKSHNSRGDVESGNSSGKSHSSIEEQPKV